MVTTCGGHRSEVMLFEAHISFMASRGFYRRVGSRPMMTSHGKPASNIHSIALHRRAISERSHNISQRSGYHLAWQMHISCTIAEHGQYAAGKARQKRGVLLAENACVRHHISGVGQAGSRYLRPILPARQARRRPLRFIAVKWPYEATRGEFRHADADRAASSRVRGSRKPGRPP